MLSETACYLARVELHVKECKDCYAVSDCPKVKVVELKH